MDTLQSEIAAVAARLVVEEGLDLGPAKRRALRQLGLGSRTPLPDNDTVLDEVHEHIALFHGDTQPRTLAALRALALHWMERLEAFRPHLTGAVWNGTATRHSDVLVQLFCDDPKSAELHLIDQGVRYSTGTTTGFRGDAVDVLSMQVACHGERDRIGLHLLVHDLDDLRGALIPDAKGRAGRGDLLAVRRMVQEGDA